MEGMSDRGCAIGELVGARREGRMKLENAECAERAELRGGEEADLKREDPDGA